MSCRFRACLFHRFSSLAGFGFASLFQFLYHMNVLSELSLLLLFCWREMQKVPRDCFYTNIFLYNAVRAVFK